MEKGVVVKYISKLIKKHIVLNRLLIWTLITNVFPKHQVNSREWELEKILISNWEGPGAIFINLPLLVEWSCRIEQILMLGFEILHWNVIFKVNELCFIHKVIGLFIESFADVVFWIWIRTTFLLIHWELTILFEVPSYYDKGIIRVVSCNDLEEVRLVSWWNIKNLNICCFVDLVGVFPELNVCLFHFILFLLSKKVEAVCSVSDLLKITIISHIIIYLLIHDLTSTLHDDLFSINVSNEAKFTLDLFTVSPLFSQYSQFSQDFFIYHINSLL